MSTAGACGGTRACARQSWCGARGCWILQMGGHALALEEALHRGGGEAHVELVAHQMVRHAVVVAVDVHVVINVHRGALPFGELVALLAAGASWPGGRSRQTRWRGNPRAS